ncbi:MFS maltose permease [Madurella fahalii]|uniref:MFS maltose permease n=1 Tax=Madurella fahalii TaxID=1157608 RepID=A0ABQ0G1S3_9PEZI
MRSRLLLFRRAAARKLQRTFAQSTAARSDLRYRPQLPFLSVPTTTAGRVRYMTTERKAQLKYEIKTGIKYVGYIWIAGICVVAAWGAIGQELLERRYPTPHEWRYATRFYFRGGHTARYEPPPGRITDWLQVGWWIERTIKKLEDPNIDGQGVKDAPSDYPPGTKDITAKSENWRRGYYEAMMFYAKAAEHMDGWVLDKSRNIVFPPGVMIGPSNPYPKPLPPGYKGAPKEEDCEPRFESPDAIYLRILSTVGFTNRQKIDAGLAYASWLDYKGISGPASIIFEDAVHLAASERPGLSSEPLNKKTWTLNDSAGPPSENLLNALTAYATFRARQGDVSAALPILVSILKARRSLPPPSDAPSLTSTLKSPAQRGTFSFLTSIFTPPPYPAPPPDGTSPPARDAKELCQEAALNLHIGEIVYASNATASSREEGLGWTREAVDVAEEQLHKLPADAREHSDARATCRECLSTGLENWATMVARLAREEEERAAAARRAREERGGKAKGWFGSLWGEGVARAEDTGVPNRWAAEAKVIEERQRRVRDMVEDLKPLPRGWQSWITA